VWTLQNLLDDSLEPEVIGLGSRNRDLDTIPVDRPSEVRSRDEDIFTAFVRREKGKALAGPAYRAADQQDRLKRIPKGRRDRKAPGSSRRTPESEAVGRTAESAVGLAQTLLVTVLPQPLLALVRGDLLPLPLFPTTHLLVVLSRV
jgi:hypothetical protein